MPDPDVRGMVIGEIKRVVIPLYTRFYDKLCPSRAQLTLDTRIPSSRRIQENILDGTKLNLME